MRTYEEIAADATDRSPFSNGTQGEIWMDRWCYVCTKDSPEMVNRGEGCPLILSALVQRTPREWTPTGVGDYECSEFERRRDDGPDDGPPPDPTPPPEVAGQLDLIDAYLDTAITELQRAPSEVTG